MLSAAFSRKLDSFRKRDNVNKHIAIMSVLFLLLTLLVFFQPSNVRAQSNNQAPSLAWQQAYGSARGIQSASNVIQTSDGGYAFMNEGWGFQDTFVPATVYKVDSLGNLSWTKTIDNFSGTAIKQTGDDGLEISGNWVNFLLHESYPTVIKMDSEGNIESVGNYSSVPNLGVTPSSVGKIRTSDGGYVYWTHGRIVKTASNNNTQWLENLMYTTIDSPNGTYPLGVCSVVETSNGAIAILGVGYNLLDNNLTGKIYLLKTEPFLPTPAQQQTWQFSTLALAILVIVLALIAFGVSIVFYRSHRKTANMKQ